MSKTTGSKPRDACPMTISQEARHRWATLANAAAVVLASRDVECVLVLAPTLDPRPSIMKRDFIDFFQGRFKFTNSLHYDETSKQLLDSI